VSQEIFHGITKKHFFSARANLRLYGTKEEYEAALSRNFGEVRFLGHFSRNGWRKAAKLTKKVKSKKSCRNDLLIKPTLSTIRIFGSAIQNAS